MRKLWKNVKKINNNYWSLVESRREYAVHVWTIHCNKLAWADESKVCIHFKATVSNSLSDGKYCNWCLIVFNHIFILSLGEWEQNISQSGSFIFYGLEKFFSHIPPFKLAPMNLAGRCINSSDLICLWFASTSGDYCSWTNIIAQFPCI